MSRKNTASLLLLVALLLIDIFCVDAAKANVTGDIAKLVPPETVLLTEIGNFNELKAQFQKTNFYKLYKDPAMTEFVEDIDKKWRQKFHSIAGKYQIPFHIISCYADQKTIKQRLRTRQNEMNPSSDANVAVMKRQLKKMAKLSDEEKRYEVSVNTAMISDYSSIIAQLQRS